MQQMMGMDLLRLLLLLHFNVVLVLVLARSCRLATAVLSSARQHLAVVVAQVRAICSHVMLLLLEIRLLTMQAGSSHKPHRTKGHTQNLFCSVVLDCFDSQADSLTLYPCSNPFISCMPVRF